MHETQFNYYIVHFYNTFIKIKVRNQTLPYKSKEFQNRESNYYNYTKTTFNFKPQDKLNCYR